MGSICVTDCIIPLVSDCHASVRLSNVFPLLARPIVYVLRQLFNECGASVWSTTVQSLDATELHARWDILSQDVRDVEVVWSPVHRDALGQLLLEQLQVY